MTRFVAAVFIIFSGAALCQSNRDLISGLKNTNGKEKIETFFKLGKNYFFTDSLTARKYYVTGTRLARNNGFHSLEIKGEWNQACLDDFYGLKFRSLNRLMRLCRHKGLSRSDSAAIFCLMANSLEKLNANKMAVNFCKKSLELGSNPVNIDRYYLVEQIARLYSRSQQFDSANLYYQKAFVLSKKINAPNLITHCLSNIGTNYLEQGNLELARHFYDEAITHFHLNDKYAGDSTLYVILKDNLAKIHTLKGEYRQALEKRKEAARLVMQVRLAASDLWLRTDLLLKLARTELDLNLLRDAKQHLDLVQIRPGYTAFQMEYYDVLSVYYEKSGEIDKSLKALRRKSEIAGFLLTNKWINARLNEFIRFQNDQIDLESEFYKKTSQQQEAINRKEKMLAVSFFTGLLCIFVLVFIVYRNIQCNRNRAAVIERKLNEEKLKYQESEAERLKLELEFKNKDLLTFALNIAKKHELTNEIAQRLQLLRKKEQFKKEDLTELVTFVRSFMSVDSEVAFQSNIIEINNQFLWRLQNRCPDLTENEKELCILIKLRLSSKDIAVIKNITTESVNVLRSRLRKKMELDSKDDLYETLEKI